MNKIRIGIVGGAGYTAGELLRVLVFHPFVEIVFVHSKSNAGKFIYEVHDDLLGDTQLSFSSEYHTDIDVVFLCVSHGEAKNIIEVFKHTKIIDLSHDHRLKSSNHQFVYGLPELQKETIKQAQYIANPGCFATAIQLALLPLAEKQLLKTDIQVFCTTGSTGAGQSLSETSHFSWRQNNLSVYKAFTHQHLAEIEQSVQQLQNTFEHEIQIIPQRGAFTRGIMACLTMNLELELEEIQNIYIQKYQDEPFVWVSQKNIHLKQVVNTNKCLLYIEKHENNLMIISIIDNLLKGASGQAVQNMNLMFGLDETTGLKLKSTAF
ncbi:N-acetyl-gamma-glutamyl-phosphate reductase [bacterium 336/3]|nr:N-acetyl-gamma-glutamyl-phosphate reductase [bacterium 336/3]